MKKIALVIGGGICFAAYFWNGPLVECSTVYERLKAGGFDAAAFTYTRKDLGEFQATNPGMGSLVDEMALLTAPGCEAYIMIIRNKSDFKMVITEFSCMVRNYHNRPQSKPPPFLFVVYEYPFLVSVTADSPDGNLRNGFRHSFPESGFESY